MRESIGLSWLMYLFLIFMFILVIIIAFGLNYMDAYRTNNAVTSCIEEREGDFGCVDSYENTASGKREGSYNSEIDVCCNTTNKKGAQYTVITYIRFAIPLFDLEVKIPVRNNSRIIHNVTCNKTASCS